MNWWPLVLQVAGGLGGITAIVALFLLPSQIRKIRSETGKTSADAAAVLTENALKMLEPAQQEINRLEARLKSANDRVTSLEAGLLASQSEVQDLRNQVTGMTKEVMELRAENSTLKGR